VAGFSLLELLVALLILQVGLLATAGMIFLAQENLARAETTTRALLEVRRVADSLGHEREPGGGQLAFPWGEVRWEAGPGPLPGLRIMALSLDSQDTLAVAMAFRPPPDSLLWRPDGSGKGGRE
jgi:hypothetical protein